MSELINACNQHTNFRRNLLANVSVVALLGYACAANADPGDTDRPTVWIELGGQLERVDGGQSLLSPPFFDKATPADLAVMSDAQKPPGYSIGGEGKISFEPSESGWIFSASVRYGRSNGGKHLHHQLLLSPIMDTFFGTHIITITPSRPIFGDAQTKSHEAHTMLDFQAGKDIGLGMFGGNSVISAGVRFAQFTSKSDVALYARPVYGFNPYVNPGKYTIQEPFRQTNTAIAHLERSVNVIGPSLSWDASARLAGEKASAEFTFDWGANAALLFGRQRASIHHHTTGYYFHESGKPFQPVIHTSHYAHPFDKTRSRFVTVPNLGGFAGVSLKFANAKLSLGYRGDFFFGAMDGGIDAAKKENRGFYGPFASISVGLGD